jgi:hypothetical protein
MKIINTGLSQSIGKIIEIMPPLIWDGFEAGKYTLSIRENETTVWGYIYDNEEDRDSDHKVLFKIINNMTDDLPF